MNAWIFLWAAVLLAALTLFSCLTVAVTIGGFIDIRKMLRQIVSQHEGESRRQADESRL